MIVASLKFIDESGPREQRFLNQSGKRDSGNKDIAGTKHGHNTFNHRRLELNPGR
jgi:hypothetical protein